MVAALSQLNSSWFSFLYKDPCTLYRGVQDEGKFQLFLDKKMDVKVFGAMLERALGKVGYGFRKKDINI